MKNKKSKMKGSKSAKNAGAKRKEAGGAVPLSIRRPALARMKRILDLLQAGKYPNCSTIAEELQISSKTVMRDIDLMRDSLDLPIEYDDKRHGFYLTKPVERFPVVPVSAREILYVCIAHKAVEFYRGTPLEQPLEMFFRKLGAQLDDEERYTMANLDEVLSFRPFAQDDKELQYFETLAEAITERRLLKFDYEKPDDDRYRPRRVRPYHMMVFSGRWYVIGYDVDRKTVRKFVPGRMRDVVVTEERFEKPKDFDPAEYFKRSMGVMTGDGDYDVLVEMDAWLTRILRGRRFHPNQEWTELVTGGSRLRLRLSTLEEIEAQVLSWGTHATVLAPVELAARVKRVGEGFIKKYAEVSSEPGERDKAGAGTRDFYRKGK